MAVTVSARTATHRLSGTGEFACVLVALATWWLVRDDKQRTRWIHRDAVKPRRRDIPIAAAPPHPRRTAAQKSAAVLRLIVGAPA